MVKDKLNHKSKDELAEETSLLDRKERLEETLERLLGAGIVVFLDSKKNIDEESYDLTEKDVSKLIMDRFGQYAVFTHSDYDSLSISDRESQNISCSDYDSSSSESRNILTKSGAWNGVKSQHIFWRSLSSSSVNEEFPSNTNKIILCDLQ